MDHPYFIVLADAHIRFRQQMKKILEELPGIKVRGEAGNRYELFELLKASPPEMVILDFTIPNLRAGEGTKLIKLQYPHIKVLIMVMDHGQEYLTHGLAAGAEGVLAKQYVAGQISSAIAAIRQGKMYVPSQVPGYAGLQPGMGGGHSSETPC